MLLTLCLEVPDRLGPGLLCRQFRERHAGELCRTPADERLGSLGHEQDPAVGVALVDDVRRRLDEMPEAGLGFAQFPLEIRVRDRDRCLVGETLEKVELLRVEAAWPCR